MKTMITMLAVKIKDQKAKVMDLEIAVNTYYNETFDPMIPSTQDKFDQMYDEFSEARESLKNMRRSLEYMMYADGRDLNPDQRYTPELYA